MAEEIVNQEEMNNQPQRKEVSPEKLKALQVAMDKARPSVAGPS